MVWKPHATVAAVIEHQGRFLLVEEKIGERHLFNNPAGHLEEGESLQEAVIREVLEETCMHFMPTALVGIYQWRHPDNGESFLRATFCGPPGRVADATLDPAILALHWLSPEAIHALGDRLRSPLVARCVDDYVAGIRYPLDLLSTITAV